MKNVLIVDDEKSVLLAMKVGFAAYMNRFTVHTAENGKVAVNILESTPIDLVVTDLMMPEMDGFELLAHIDTHFPNIPVIIITAFVTSEIKVKLCKNNGRLNFLKKPVNYDALAQAILKSIVRKYKKGPLTGVSLPGFLKLIEMEQNTCLMEVSTPSGKRGLLYFYKGVLHDAVLKYLKGEDAAYAIIGLDNVKINFRPILNRHFKRNIKTNLATILKDVTLKKRMM